MSEAKTLADLDPEEYMHYQNVLSEFIELGMDTDVDMELIEDLNEFQDIINATYKPE